jgi:hypothetical protein
MKPIGFISEKNAIIFLNGLDKRISGMGCMISEYENPSQTFALYTSEQIKSLLEEIAELEDRLHYYHDIMISIQAR